MNKKKELYKRYKNNPHNDQDKINCIAYRNYIKELIQQTKLTITENQFI